MRLNNYQLRGNSGGMWALLCALIVIVFMAGNMMAQKTRRRTGRSNTQAPSKPKTITNSIGMNFVLIEAGSFQMGGNKAVDERPVHKVTISRPFYLQTTEVTQAQWEALMSENPSQELGPDRPVEYVSWNDCQEFIKRLNAKERTDKYRLPSEAEWEYACRAGCRGDCIEKLDERAWWGKNSGDHTHPVGQKKPNAWGLYDIQGNVEEWCQDWYGKKYYRTSPEMDPKGPENKALGWALRGGSWASRPAVSLGCARRDYGIDPVPRHPDYGVRLARTQ